MICSMSIFPSFFFKSFVRKNWRGVGESIMQNGTIRLLNILFSGRIYVAWGPWHLGNFCNILLPNISEDQKNLLSERWALALCHMENTALVIALRL